MALPAALAELYEAGGFDEPAAGVDQIPDLMVRARHVGRGGWYTLRFASGHLAVTAHDPVPLWLAALR
jgi:hypothetical protein